MPSRTCIHKFSSSNLLVGSSSAASTTITSIAQSPAIDVLGIGFASGEISIFDIRADERLMRIFMREGGVRALSFRSGTFSFLISPRAVLFPLITLTFKDGQPILASASEMGHISLWDLGANGRLLHTVRGAHDGGITSLEWVPGQPVLISSGEDNSVKVCFFPEN